MDLSAITPEKNKVQAPAKADEEKEKNMVPLEEAMAVAEKSESRVLVLDIVRRDISQSLSTILLALNSSDSEVAHYAASILQDSLGTFRENVNRLWNMILDLEAGLSSRRDEQVKRREAVEQEMVLAKELISDMGAVLKQKVFTEPEQAAFLRQMELLMKLVDFRDIPGVEVLTTVCAEETRSGMYDEAEVWCRRMRELYPDALDTWKCSLHLAYEKEDYGTFRKWLEEMKHTDVELDEEMVGMIRFFGKR